MEKSECHHGPQNSTWEKIIPDSDISFIHFLLFKLPSIFFPLNCQVRSNLEVLSSTKAHKVALYFQMLPSSVQALHYKHLHLKTDGE